MSRQGGPERGPVVFAGLWCHCGERHTQGAGYYVSVQDGSSYVLALGPYPEHYQALARVDDVRRVVLDRWNPRGEAHWYSYGTLAIHGGDSRTGKLNAEVGL
jgi:hypothetical protein